MSTFIRKSHNVSVLLYPVVCGSKYRRAVFNADVDRVLQEDCPNGQEHHGPRDFPPCAGGQAAALGRGVLVKQQLWGGAFWPWGGYFIDTVGRHGSEETIRRYVQQQGCEQEYKRLYQQPINLAFLDAGQMELF